MATSFATSPSVGAKNDNNNRNTESTLNARVRIIKYSNIIMQWKVGDRAQRVALVSCGRLWPIVAVINVVVIVGRCSVSSINPANERAARCVPLGRPA